MIVVYAEAMGNYKDNNYVRKTYSRKFYGKNGLSGIQPTTAGSGVAILELMGQGRISGIIDHKDVDYSEFENTITFKTYYENKS